MKRLRRYIFKGLTAFSLLLCVAAGVLWARSYRVYDQWGWRLQTVSGDALKWDSREVAAVEGLLVLRAEGCTVTSDAVKYIKVGAVEPVQRYWRQHARFAPEFSLPVTPGLTRFGFAALHFKLDDTVSQPYMPPSALQPPLWVGQRSRDVRVFVVPLWAIFLVTVIRPGWVMFRSVRRWRRRLGRGFCHSCGYDLRATPARCPECGVEAGAIGVRK